MHRTGARTTRRADAEHNTARILAAAAACLSRSPTASMGEIAQAAGLGRVTVYGHFPSREALIEATLTASSTKAKPSWPASTSPATPARPCAPSSSRDGA